MATQAPQASRWAAPRAAKAAAVVTWVYAVCFGLPAIPVAVYVLQTGQLPWLFDAFPMYGGPWYDSRQPERFAAQLGAFVVVMLVVSWGGWLLWRGSRAGAVVAVATIPVDHVSLTVTNLNVSAQFYTEVLGFTVVLDFGYALACIHKTTGFMLSLIRHSDGTGTRFTHRQTGLDHLGLTARNRTELLGWEQRLREPDVEFTPLRGSELGHHLSFRDPDGIALEFYAPNDRFAAALDELHSRKFSDEDLLDAAEQLGLGAHVAQRI